MSEPLRAAVAGVGNNISALVQGICHYRQRRAAAPGAPLPGVRNPVLGGLAVEDVTFVGALDVDPRKVGSDLSRAALAHPNNYPPLGVQVPHQGVTVQLGLEPGRGRERLRRRIEELAAMLREARAEVLLYSLPTGLQDAADAYAELALEAGVAFVNCTPEVIARDARLLERFADAGLPLVGDDLASHVGSSVVHRALLELFSGRGVTVTGSYQLNIGGNEDFRNLLRRGDTKRASKLNALAGSGVERDRISVVPAAGFVPHLGDRKVGMINIDAIGWGETRISLDVRLDVQDSSNAAGVVIDLVRIAAAAGRHKLGGFPIAAATLLKSPPGGHDSYPVDAVDAAWRQLLETG